MIRFGTLLAMTMIATSSLAYATTPAEPLPPLSPTKDKSLQKESVTPEETIERHRQDSRRKAMKTTIRTQQKTQGKVAKDLPPETGTKGRVHVPSKAVKHESAKDPANQKPPAAPGAYEAPYNN